MLTRNGRSYRSRSDSGQYSRLDLHILDRCRSHGSICHTSISHIRDLLYKRYHSVKLVMILRQL